MGPLLPPAVWLQGVLFCKSENTYLTVIAMTISMGWPRSNLDIAQTRTCIDIRSFCLLDSYPQLMVLSRTSPRHFTVEFQPTRQDAGTNKLAVIVLPLTQSTLLPVLLTKDLNTLTLNKSRIEHIHQGHQRHDHPTCCYIHHTKITTHSRMETQPLTP